MSEEESPENEIDEEEDQEAPVAVDSPVIDKGGSEEEDDEEKDEEEEAIPDNPLVQEMIPESLSMLCKIGNGLSHAYVKMTCSDMALTNIDLMKQFIHVRYVDFSGNMLVDLSPLDYLTHLIALKAEKNNLTSAELEPHPYLQILNLAGNKIKNLIGIDHPQLAKLNLNFNIIDSPIGLDSKVLSNLQTLELRGNKLNSTAGLALPSLQNLYLAGNQLTKLEGLEDLRQLQVLHVRDNQIESFDGFSSKMMKLQYLNVRGNQIKQFDEIQKLACLPLLRAMVLSENPCAEEENYRTEVLIALRRLVRLDKDEYSDDDRADAEDIYNQRKQEEFNNEEEEEVVDLQDEED